MVVHNVNIPQNPYSRENIDANRRVSMVPRLLLVYALNRQLIFSTCIHISPILCRTLDIRSKTDCVSTGSESLKIGRNQMSV